MIELDLWRPLDSGQADKTGGPARDCSHPRSQYADFRSSSRFRPSGSPACSASGGPATGPAGSRRPRVPRRSATRLRQNLGAACPMNGSPSREPPGWFVTRCPAFRTGPAPALIRIRPTLELRVDAGRVDLLFDAEIVDLGGSVSSLAVDGSPRPRRPWRRIGRTHRLEPARTA